MPRPKEFDENAVLFRALELFRARGFHQTSFSDLVDELGVSRQSLYDTYGDKQALFQAALRRYLDHGLGIFRTSLAEPGPVRPVLERLFENLVRFNCDGGAHGCFMVNSMVELAPHDAATRALAQEHAREVETALASRLGAAQRAGDLGRAKDPVALAHFLYHTILGLSVASRALGERDSLRETVRLALSTLD